MEKDKRQVKATLFVSANKYFHPDAKNFEHPFRAQTEAEKDIANEYGGIRYKNADGTDTVSIRAPISLLGPKTLKFAAAFVAGHLKDFTDFEQEYFEKQRNDEPCEPVENTIYLGDKVLHLGVEPR